MKTKTNKEAQAFEIDEFTQKSLEVEFEPVEIDLNICSRGDRLITRNGMTLYYEKPLNYMDFYDHEIWYDEEMTKPGSRTNNGQVLKSVQSDMDVIQIIKNKRK